jgi:RND family efflux transporter MFP subunit
MNKCLNIILGASLMAASAMADELATQAPRPANAPYIQVKTTKATINQLTSTLTAYGEVQPDPATLTAINTGYAGQVGLLPISLGQKVAAGETLLELDTDPAARMAYLQAVSGVEYARSELVRSRQLFNDQLATRGEVAAVEKALQNAQTALAMQKSLGTDQARQVIRAPFSGVVNSLNVALGDRVQAGATLLSLAQRGDLLIALGVEPEDIEQVKTGAQVKLASVFDTKREIHTKVAEVHGVVNPATRLIDAVVRIKGQEAGFLMPGMKVRGTITVVSTQALAVPRTAILMDQSMAANMARSNRGGKTAYLFRVVHGRARRVNVRTGISAHGLVAVKGRIRLGDRVVILGNYELTDGARIAEPKS